jgi:integrase
LTSRIAYALDAASVDTAICLYHNLGTLDRHFRRCRSAAKVPPDVVLHSLRHRFATQLLRSGVNLLDIRDLLGHSDIATTSIYLASDPRRFASAREALECATEVINGSLILRQR